MTTTINASPSNGLVQTADGSGVIKVQSNGVTTNAIAWVNFNGITTTSIASQYNVSSVTRNGTGDYTVNFAANLSDANYAIGGFSVGYSSSNIQGASIITLVPSGTGTYLPLTKTVSAVRVMTGSAGTGNLFDSGSASIIIFGN